MASLTAEIEKLEDRLAKTAAARVLLDKVEVVDALFLGRVENRPGTAEVRLTVKNETEHLIQRIRFEAVLAVPGSSKPVLQGKIDSNRLGGAGEESLVCHVPNGRFSMGDTGPSGRCRIATHADSSGRYRGQRACGGAIPRAPIQG